MTNRRKLEKRLLTYELIGLSNITWSQHHSASISHLFITLLQSHTIPTSLCFETYITSTTHCLNLTQPHIKLKSPQPHNTSTSHYRNLTSPLHYHTLSQPRIISTSHCLNIRLQQPHITSTSRDQWSKLHCITIYYICIHIYIYIYTDTNIPDQENRGSMGPEINKQGINGIGDQ